MMKHIGFMVLLTLLAGCGGGLKISSLTADAAKNAHKAGKNPGYIVYHPMIVVAVNRIMKAENGKLIVECVVGKPQTLPDYGKPFLLEPIRGIGKSSVDLIIEDGWRLAGVKTESDNTAWLKFAKEALIAGTGGGLSDGIPKQVPGLKPSCQPGFYKLNNAKQFERMQGFPEG